MKIQAEHYERMRDAMRKRVGGKLAELRKPYDDAGLSAERFRWDLWSATRLCRHLSNKLYEYLDDSHIDTALRCIIKELES